MVEDAVNTRSLQYLENLPIWGLIESLLGGTQMMRDAGTLYLPQETKEESTAYNNRVLRSFLFSALRDTIDKLSGKPFVKPITFEKEETLPEELENFYKDVDANGTTLQQFALRFFNTALTYGINFALIDFSDLSDELPETLEDEQRIGGRPLFIEVSPPQLIGWKIEQTPKGDQELTEIRIEEKFTRTVGNYSEEIVTQIRVYTRDIWEIHTEVTQENGEKVFQVTKNGVHDFGEIPLVIYYVDKTSMMTADPPFRDLAWLNLAHWQSASDQRNILRFSRFGILHAKGFSEDDLGKKLTIGPSSLVKSTDPNSELKYVEHTGKGIEAGLKDLENLEGEMTILGLQPMLQQSGGVTATAKAIDEGRSQSAIQSWIMNLEGALLRMYRFAAKWYGIDELSDEFKISIFNQFVLSLRASEDIASLIEMRKNKQLTQETQLNEVKRRGLLSENVNIPEEVLKLEQEAGDMGVLSEFINSPPTDMEDLEDEEE